MNQYGQQYGYYQYSGYPNNQHSYQQPYQQFQQPIQQNYQNTQQTQYQNEINNATIPCMYVDSVKVVEATNSDMSGKPLLFMKSDGTEIYRKQINPNTGASDLFTYEIKKVPEQNISQQTIQYDFSDIGNKIDDFKKEIYGSISSFSKEMSELKDLVLESITAPSSKDNQKVGDRR